MKRILLIMAQPPGCSGVQALIYNKILPYLEDGGWEFHFAGPSPRLISVLTEPLDYPQDRLHYTDHIAWSRRFSVRKNRCPPGTLPYLLLGALQFFAGLGERWFSFDAAESLRRGLSQVVLEADRRWNFDLIAGKSPGFEFLVLAGASARQLRKPFVALVDDPHGYRSSEGFVPSDPQLQKALLDQCCGAIFMSPLTRERYLAAGLVSAEKAHEITDSYPQIPALYSPGRSQLASPVGSSGDPESPHPFRLIHLGVLPRWRPIEPLLEALEATGVEGALSLPPLELHLFGFLYPEAQSRIQRSPRLAAMVSVSKSVSYAQSHWLAEDAEAQLVVIGPRHVDNQPSKFFEYLGHRKPLLVIGPAANPIHAIVRELGIGVYADIESPSAILEGIEELVAGYPGFKASFDLQREKIDAYGAHSVARQWCELLDSIHRHSL